MELEQLKTLVAIEHEGTVSAAAEALHTSQPAVSRCIKRLEDDLGQRLFDRTRNSVTFNEAGHLALSHAHDILAAERRMRDAFDELSRRQRTVHVWSAAPAPTWKLAEIMATSFPETILQTEVVAEDEVERALLNQDASLAITVSPMRLPHIRSFAFMTEDLSISAPADHPLAQRASVSFSDIDGETFLVLDRVGFWKGVVHRNMPNSSLIPQKDLSLFTQLLQSSNLLGFTTAEKENVRITGARATVPITDADAHATYFLCARQDASEQALAIFEAAKQAAGLASS